MAKGSSSSSDGGGAAIPEIPNDHGIKNSKLAEWNPNIDEAAEILSVLGGILGYLIFIYGLSFTYGKYQDRQNAEAHCDIDDDESEEEAEAGDLKWLIYNLPPILK